MSVLGTVPVFPGWGSAESLDLKFSNNVYFSGDTGIEDCEALSSTLGTEQFIEDTNLGDSFVYDSQLQAHFRPLGTTASSRSCSVLGLKLTQFSLRIMPRDIGTLL